MPVVTQHFDNAAVADPSVATFVQHAQEFLPQDLQLLKANFHLFKLRPGDGISSRTTRFGIVRQLEQFTDFADAEAKFAGMADKL